MLREAEQQKEGRKTRTHPDVRSSPYSAAPQALSVCVPAWGHPPRYLFARNNRKKSQRFPSSRHSGDRSRLEVAAGTYFAPYSGQRCDMWVNVESRIYTVSSPHIKHSGLRGHATMQVSRSSTRREDKASL